MDRREFFKATLVTPFVVTISPAKAVSNIAKLNIEKTETQYEATLPAGAYTVMCTDVQDRVLDSGHTGIMVDYAILEPKAMNGKKFKQYVSLESPYLYRLKDILKKMHFDLTQAEFDLADMIGRSIGIDIQYVADKEGRLRNRHSYHCVV